MESKKSDQKIQRVSRTENIYSLGRGLFGTTPGSAYLIDSDKKTLIETGTSEAANRIIHDLSELGIKKLDYIAVTHIHLDHAGGAWLLSEKFPDAKVIVHERGAEHLINPSVLKKSAKQATGKFFKYYGEIKPLPRDKITPVSGGEEFELGEEYILIPIDTPGHAPHHLCYYGSEDEILYTGDAAGIYYSERNELLPTTPPPNFDLEKNLETLKILRNFDLSLLAYTHWGWSDAPMEKLRAYEDILSDWVNEVKEARDNLGENQAIEPMIGRHLPEWAETDDEKRFFRSLLTMNKRGVLNYLSRK